MSDELAFLPARDLTELYRQTALSPVEATRLALTRADGLQASLNAFQMLDRDGAMAAAKASEKRWHRGEPCGPLDGLPLTIKDLSAVKGLPMRSGSLTTSDEPCAEDAPCVARLREAGAVILGKTTTPEFGWKGLTDGPLFGYTRNPWDPARTPGGSSGGAATALAAGIGWLAQGNDGGGSIRIPASYCGLFGIKPSFGRVPHHPREGAFCDLVSNGPIARKVADAALMMTIMSQPDRRDWYALPWDGTDYLAGLEGAESALEGLSVAYAPNLGGAEPKKEILEPIEATVALFEELGARVERVDSLFEPLREAFESFWIAGFAALIRELPIAERDKLDPRFRALAERGLQVGLAEYDKAMSERARLAGRLAELHESYAILVTPTMATPPPPVETLYDSSQFDRWRDVTPFTLPFNLTGQPAASLPCGYDSSGLPVGLQIVGPRYQDLAVLRVARALEQALDLPLPHPRLLESLARLAGGIRA